MAVAWGGGEQEGASLARKYLVNEGKQRGAARGGVGSGSAGTVGHHRKSRRSSF
jgi:hypothetical protein